MGDKPIIEENISPIVELLYTLKVKEVMETEVISVKKNWTIEQVKELLKTAHITGTPVIDDNNIIVGVISMSDILDALSSNGIHDKVDKWMTKEPITIHPETNLIKALQLIDSYKVGRLPVIDDNKKVIGIITNGIIVKNLLFKMDQFSRNTENEMKQLTQQLHLDDIKIDKPIKIKWPLKKNDFKNAGKLSSELKKLLKKKNIDRNIIRRIAIATYEAEINIIIHSIGGYADINIDAEKLTALFIDYGPGIENIELAMKEGYSTAPTIARELGFGAGMGLPNIKKSVDEFCLESEPGKGTRLMFTIYFNSKNTKEVEESVNCPKND